MRCNLSTSDRRSTAWPSENGPTCDIANPIKWNGLRIDPPAISILFFSLVIHPDPRDQSSFRDLHEQSVGVTGQSEVAQVIVTWFGTCMANFKSSRCAGPSFHICRALPRVPVIVFGLMDMQEWLAATLSLFKSAEMRPNPVTRRDQRSTHVPETLNF